MARIGWYNYCVFSGETTPVSGTFKIGVDSITQHLSILNDAGVVRDLEIASINTPMSYSGGTLDWSVGYGFDRITITANTTVTFSNLVNFKTASGEFTGNFTLTLPSYCVKLSGTYDGTKINLIQFYCTNNVSGSESVWYIISQPA